MIGTFFAWASATPWALRLARWGAIALAILLFLLSVRRAGEGAGRMAEHSKPWRPPMTSNAGCWTRRLAVLVLAASWLGACATDSSETTPVAVCPPVVEYSEEFQARAAEELVLLPEGSAVVEMLGDYAVMREQARLCAEIG